ncbi:hypothetical protein BDN72DRAFT_49485 [Pluteus cervinus]|uniref:Uncharacterized protein n=1 Tax=Pluteus cervinus TaxID=181527 RepID=A0ACD3BII3_9AGAR|nr:hypothetical protein BDN72DRAFT_49485 [Pluteus cervinus]
MRRSCLRLKCPLQRCSMLSSMRQSSWIAVVFPTKRLEKLTREEEDADMPMFYNYWRKKTLNEMFKMDVLPLVFDEDKRSRMNINIEQEVFVRASYRSMYQRAAFLRRYCHDKAVLVTGQPGTGKTLWLWFMLVCVIASQKPVVFHYHGKTRLLHDGCVYLITESPSYFFKRMSNPPTRFQLFTWCLIDTDQRQLDPPMYLVESGTAIHPVQVSLPNSGTYLSRLKRKTTSFDMPLWSPPELMEGLKLDQRYQNVLTALTENNDTIQNCVERYIGLERLVQHYEASFGQLIASERVQSSFQWLLDQLILKYGPIPRDLYSAIFDDYY